MNVATVPAPSPKPSPAWRRPLGLAESLFWQLDRIICGNFIAYVELDGVVTQEELARGLAALVQAHPLLRARIVEDVSLGRPCFQEVEAVPPELTQVAPEALRSHWMRELDRTFASDSEPLFRAHLATDGARSWVGLTFHHSIGDGRTGAKLLNELVPFLDQGLAPAPSAPPPAQESFYRPEAFGAPDKAHHFATVVADIRARAQTLAPGNLVPGLCERTSLTRENGHHELELSSAQTNALLQTCRRHGATVHGALGAAYLGALHTEFLTPGRSVVMSLASPVDLRASRRSPSSSEDVGLRLSGVVSRIRMSDSSEFWELARTFTRDVREQIDLGNAHLLHELVYTQTPPGLTREHGAAILEGMRRFPWNSVITNVGRLPALEPGRRLTLRHMGFLGAPTPSQALVMSIGTYGGLRIHTVYDRQNLGQPRAESLLGRFEERLRAAIDT
ncbi:phthiocerol/phthiodiolone dimycocerosyl transferase family protein [Pyxidicoccus xibeiensis]|uniref:phthiocerol/phthiodiolone dimycocerosyl transferase family protein n=1 Tax=Pyxidicoccus xibeiensis TaxID=2906759 RepID=UPI0020A7C1B5|nr:condensation domain-containing protein [Pyxidicoccus xibeiensis]MCP3142304.1 condensation domain-containing protein [Pyxidicoccus xibeiensis]